MNPRLEKLLFNSARMPTLPGVYQRIKEAVEDPGSSFEDIARIVSGDQSLSARLLRLANSSFYGYPSDVFSVPDALAVIGLQQFKNMALSTCIMDVFRDVPASLCDIEDFWRHSIACGLCARIMALELREANSERFFLGGLMHKIGRLVILQEEPDKAVQILKRAQREDLPLHLIEQEVLGYDHCEVGAALLELWKLPPSLGELPRHYLKPILARDSVQDASLVHLAVFVVETLHLGSGGGRFAPEFSEAAWGHSGLGESRLYYIVEELLRQHDEVCSVFLAPTAA